MVLDIMIFCIYLKLPTGESLNTTLKKMNIIKNINFAVYITVVLFSLDL